MMSRATYKPVIAEDGTRKLLYKPDFGLYHVSGAQAMDGERLYGEMMEMDEEDIEDAEDQVADGVTERRSNFFQADYQLAVVIGENDEARMAEYHYTDAHLPEDNRRVIRWARPNRSPQFGDTVLVLHSSGADYRGFWKFSCDTTAANEFLLCNGRRDRWIRVKRNAEIVISDLRDIPFLVKTFEDAVSLTS